MTKSPITAQWRQKRTLTALGLRKMHQTVEKPDNLAVRGMIHKVEHLVTVEEVEK
jgi:large subunit ribosomal protein L30